MDIIDILIKEECLKTPAIIRAFQKIQRRDFLTPDTQDRAEENNPLPIGYKQTISQPETVAFMIELLQPEGGDRVLDVGSGSGWTSCLLADLVGKGGSVIGLEKIDALRRFGERNSAKYGFAEQGRLKFVTGDGHEGLPDEGPFDRILVSAAAPDVPVKLLEQLVPDGVMVIPLGEWFGAQDIVWIKKIDDHKYEERRYPGFVFVPLVKE